MAVGETGAIYTQEDFAQAWDEALSARHKKIAGGVSFHNLDGGRGLVAVFEEAQFTAQLAADMRAIVERHFETLLPPAA